MLGSKIACLCRLSFLPIAAAMSGPSSSRGLREEWTPGPEWASIRMTDEEIDGYNRNFDMQEALWNAAVEKNYKTLCGCLKMPEDKVMKRKYEKHIKTNIGE